MTFLRRNRHDRFLDPRDIPHSAANWTPLGAEGFTPLSSLMDAPLGFESDDEHIHSAPQLRDAFRRDRVLRLHSVMGVRWERDDDFDLDFERESRYYDAGRRQAESTAKAAQRVQEVVAATEKCAARKVAAVHSPTQVEHPDGPSTITFYDDGSCEQSWSGLTADKRDLDGMPVSIEIDADGYARRAVKFSPQTGQHQEYVLGLWRNQTRSYLEALGCLPLKAARLEPLADSAAEIA